MEKIWLQSYPKGVPHEIHTEAFESVVDLLDKSCKDFARDPAFYNLGVTISYKQFDEYALAFASYLQQVLKLKKGDRIALMMPNILQYPVAILGALRAGLIVVNVNPLYTPPELIHQLNDSGANTILVMANFANTVEKALTQTPQVKNVIITEIGDLFPRPKAWFFHIILKYIKKKIPKVHIPNVIDFRKAIVEGGQLTFEKVALHHDDLAFLQYTGGTTGVAKGAMLTHKNIIANILQAEAWFSPVFEREKEIMITALPIYHIFCLTANILFITKLGGLNVLITDPRNIGHLIAEMSKFKFTVVTGVNTLYLAMINHKDFSKLDFSAMKISLGGGMSVQRSVAERWQALTKRTLLEAYGLTETSPCVLINPPNLSAYNGTVGLPVPSTDVCILNDARQELPIDQAGELAVKGPQVMLGYWHNQNETQKVFTENGWLLTGDVASINREGYVRILERKKDMILVSGFNVYPNEIEDVLIYLKGVREAAVVGVPDEHSGEAVKAFIVRSDKNLTKEDVLQYCRGHLTGYKIPKYVEFCNELPKTNVGKILRRALKTNTAAVHQ